MFVTWHKNFLLCQQNKFCFLINDVILTLIKLLRSEIVFESIHCKAYYKTEVRMADTLKSVGCFLVLSPTMAKTSADKQTGEYVHRTTPGCYTPRWAFLSLITLPSLVQHAILLPVCFLWLSEVSCSSSPSSGYSAQHTCEIGDRHLLSTECILGTISAHNVALNLQKTIWKYFCFPWILQ